MKNVYVTLNICINKNEKMKINKSPTQKSNKRTPNKATHTYQTRTRN